MSAPKDVLAQLLSPGQAETLDAAGREAWASAAAALQGFLGALPGVEGVRARLVMPEEVVGEFESPHIAVPLLAETDLGQSATAYLAAPTPAAATFFGVTETDPAEQAQQAMVLASTVLNQAVNALNDAIFAASPLGLVLSAEDAAADCMPAAIEPLDEPALFLEASVEGPAPLPLSLFLPGGFLDLVAAALPQAATAGAAPADTQSAIDPALGFTLSAADLEAAELVEMDSVPAPRPLATAGARTGGEWDSVGAGPASREPLPISQATAHRARFAPLEEPAAPPAHMSGMDLLAGLRMNVVVELGRTELTVSDVLGLGPGSVVELDRLAGEPVDILVNDRLIARGEVVVVDENFGVRVVEVVRRGADAEERAG